MQEGKTGSTEIVNLETRRLPLNEMNVDEDGDGGGEDEVNGDEDTLQFASIIHYFPLTVFIDGSRSLFLFNMMVKS
jgi:hypothetical protein